jgi:hypothetical protein
MGNQVSYINADGTLRDAKEFYTVSDGSKTEPLPAGEPSYEGTVKTFKYLRDNDIAPFLVVRAKPTGFGRKEPYPIWDDIGTRGWAWSVRRIPDVIVRKSTFETDYIYVGDAVGWDQDTSDLYNNPAFTPNLYSQPWLFAHKSICYRVPSVATASLVKDFQYLYIGDPSRESYDIPALYKSLGFFGSSDGYRVVVCRAFMKATPWKSRAYDVFENCCGGIYFTNQVSKGSTVFVNTLSWSRDGALDVNYEICATVDEAVDNWMSCILQKSSEMNAIFQGFLIPETKLRNEVRAQNVMRAFCKTNVESIAYPKICACIGRAGVEDALRKQMDNNLVRMVCQSPDCLDGDRTGDVYTFKPTPPCAPLNICKPGLDVNAAKVTMSNVTFNCNFDSNGGPPPTSTKVKPLPAPVKPKAPAPQKGLTTTVKITLGAAGAVVVLIVIIIIIIVLRSD